MKMFPHPVAQADTGASTLDRPAGARSPVALAVVAAISLGVWGSLAHLMHLL